MVYGDIQNSRVVMAADEYRSAKEAFVSGLSGTSLWEISVITATLSAGYLLMSVAIVCLPVVQHLKLNSTLSVHS